MHLFLMGYRGCGKSTVGRQLASLLGRAVVDTDDQIEKQAGMSIRDMFDELGEPGFRRQEQQVVEQFAQQNDLIISLGGGAPLAPENRAWMKQTGKTVWLRAEPEVLWSRIDHDESSFSRRPDLTDQGGLEEVRRVLSARDPVYKECADYEIDVQELTPQQIAEKIADWWNSVDKI